MRHSKYLTTAILMTLAIPVMGSELIETPKKELDVSNIKYIESPRKIELGFDTAKYLPEDFNPYRGEVTVTSLNYIEDDEVNLGFDTAKYLPENFNPYK